MVKRSITMKRCPECNKVFEQERRYCTHDGADLVPDEFALPSEFVDDEDEQQTVLRINPPVSGQRPPVAPNEVPKINSYSRADPQLPVPPALRPKGGCFKYFLVLVIGLILGGGFVVAIFGIGYWYIYEQTRVERDVPIEPAIAPPKTAPSKRSDAVDHKKRNSNADEDDLNGRVIAGRAVVRAAPSKSAKRMGVIPQGDRLEIIRRRSKTSPWYEVECEHGLRGWMHGNTIQFVDP